MGPRTVTQHIDQLKEKASEIKKNMTELVSKAVETVVVQCGTR